MDADKAAEKVLVTTTESVRKAGEFHGFLPASDDFRRW